MKITNPGVSFTISLLFFGLALLDAIQTQDWLRVAFWLIIGVGFLAADNLMKRKTRF